MNDTREPLYGPAAARVRDQLREPGDLAIAISVAQKMLAAYSDTSSFGEFGYAQAHGALSESLRILLRALDAEPLTEAEAARRSVDRAFPAVAAFLDAEHTTRGEGQ
ncbi:hypothetical protein [Streptomyces apocyni]|uniref:hypothetical protein n=1 Tax=Streptomyces apocyni TaxID=2654677 RepID=UPI0012E9BC5E|nr:hypothetical protein [Streptomyces apocyni]